MVRNKGRLNQMFFRIFFEKQIQNISDPVPVFKFDVMLLGKPARLFRRFNLFKIHAGIFQYRIAHGNPPEWLVQIDDLVPERNFSRPVYRF